jgi:hypothetical protein
MLLYQTDTSHINNPYLSNKEAVELGKRLKADIILVGTAIAQVLPDTMGATVRSFRADLSIRVIRTDTGEEITSMDQQSTEVSTDDVSGGRDALSKAGTLVGKALAPRIAQAWKNSETTSGQIQIFVNGTSNLGSFVSLRKSLAQIPGVTNLRIKETMTDEALILVDYKDSAQDLAGAIMQKSFDNFRINIFEVGQKHISMDLIPDQGARPR